MLKILHIAVENFAGVPLSFVKMHRAMGDQSTLVTFYHTAQNFPEELSLNFKIHRNFIAKTWRQIKVIQNAVLIQKKEKTYPFYFEPKNFLESLYFDLRESFRRKRIYEFIEKHKLYDYDIIHYDGGMDFFRDSHIAKQWKIDGKKIVCCYFGSDLRARGLMKELDKISDLNLTTEFDHLQMHPDIHYIFYPYEPDDIPQRIPNESEKVRIVHSPTNRKFKGTDLILKVIKEIKKERNIEFLLLEKMPREKVLSIKATCDICIDQVGGKFGGTGYGKSGLESLAMGIPTITNMTEEYQSFLKENPFVVANNAKELKEKLIELIDNKNLREEIGKKSIEWLKKYHSYENVNKRLLELYKTHGIL